MKGPRLENCCCCLPLRKGLLLWGYLRLLGDLVSATQLIGTAIKRDSIEFGVAVTFDIVDAGFTLMFLIAAHKKNPNRIRIYMYYVVFAILLYIINFFATLMNYGLPIMDEPQSFKYLTDIPIAANIFIEAVSVLFEVYLILLLRSEVIKLQERLEEDVVSEIPHNNIVTSV